MSVKKIRDEDVSRALGNIRQIEEAMGVGYDSLKKIRSELMNYQVTRACFQGPISLYPIQGNLLSIAFLKMTIIDLPYMVRWVLQAKRSLRTTIRPGL